MALLFFGLLALFLIFYFMPTWIAFRKGHPARWLIFLVNLLLGGTVLGWLIAIIWASSEDDSDAAGSETTANLVVKDPLQVHLLPQPPVPESLSVSIEQIANELLRLKSLHDDQVIKTEEFEELKRRLIQRA